MHWYGIFYFITKAVFENSKIANITVNYNNDKLKIAGPMPALLVYTDYNLFHHAFGCKYIYRKGLKNKE